MLKFEKKNLQNPLLSVHTYPNRICRKLVLESQELAAALSNFIRSILRANDNAHRFNLFAMSSRFSSSYLYIYYIEQERRCYLVLEWNQKRRGSDV